jgi:hypothetical protein
MKRLLTFALVAASAGFIAAGTASAIDTYNDNDAATGIGGSRHNLGGFSNRLASSNTTEICVFCHTPHHTNTANNIKPLWNRGTQTASYTAYGNTIGGSSIASSDIGSTTLACLSCHDGVTTFDNLVNAPGKNGVTAGGSDRSFTFWDATVPGVVSDFMTSARVNIGVDLSNDHPVSVVYNDTVAGLRPTDTVIANINLAADLATSASTFDNGNLTKNLWAVKGYIDAGATIGDLLRSGKVECSSCHDPHFNNKSFNEVDATYSDVGVTDLEQESNGLFLRRVGGNTGSGVCRTCHNK